MKRVVRMTSSHELSHTESIWHSLTHCLWGCKMLGPFWKFYRQSLKALKIESACDPAISPLSTHLREVALNLHMKTHRGCSQRCPL